VADNRVIFEVIATAKGVQVVQKQTDQLAKSTDKAERSTKNLDKTRDRYNRREKGAAQISSNTTKNFSKMQQSIDGGGGAGGLVRAYALLAANVFAVTAAFGVLSRSAQVDKLTESLEIFSVRGGQFVANIAKDLQEASGAAINFADASRNVSLALSAGLDTSQIQDLTKVARGASVALGRSLPDALDRIFRGVIKLEPEILDEIGLFVRVDEASQKYAQSLGKTVTSLTSVEKRQAFLAEATEQGLKKFEEFSDTIETTAFDKLGASLIDIAQNLTSFVNKGLTPIVSFLAENRAILTGVFVAIAGLLLKTAIPAIGQFNSKLAESASLALADQKAYLQGIEKKSDAARVFAIEEEKRNLKAQKKLTRGSFKGVDAQFKSRAKDAKENERLLKKNLGTTDKLAAVNQRIGILEKASAKAKGENKKLIDEELKGRRNQVKELEKQLKIENKLAGLKTKATAPVVGLAAKKEAQLESRVATSSALAQISGVGETQGIRAGFADLFQTIKSGEVVTEEGTKKLTRFGKASVAVKGSVGLLTTGVQSLMMTLGPWIAAFAMLSPLLGLLAQKLGFFSKEAKELNKTLDRVADLTENLAERFEKQVEGIQSSSLSFVENVKASSAFNKSIQEAATSIIEINTRLNDFKENSTGSVKAWESFKKIFGLDKETKAVTQQLELAQKSIKAALEAGDSDLAKALLGGDNQALKDFVELNRILEIVDKKLNETRRAFIATPETASAFSNIKNQISELITKYQIGDQTLIEFSKSFAEQAEGQKDFIGVSKEVIANMVAMEIAYLGNVDAIDDLKKADIDFVQTSQDVIQITQERTKRLDNFVAAVEGAKDSVGKFTNSFLPKTKVDEVLSSLEQIQSSFGGLFEQLVTEAGTSFNVLDPDSLQKFLKNFDTDNPISRLFSKEETQKIKDFAAALKFDDADAIIQNVIEQFANFQNQILKAKAAQKALNSEIKTLNDVVSKGVSVGNRLYQQRLALADSQYQINLVNLQANLRAQGVDEKRAATIADLVDNAKTYEEIQVSLIKFSLSNAQLQSIAASFEEKRLALIEKRVIEATKKQTQDIEEQKALQFLLNLEKDRLEISRKLVENVAKVNRLRRTGSSNLDPAQEAKISIQTAKDSLDIAIQEANIKFTILKAEQAILQKRLEVLAEEEKTSAQNAVVQAALLQTKIDKEKDANEKLRLETEQAQFRNIAKEKFASEQRVKNYASELGAVTDIYDEILRKTTANAANEFVVTLSDAIAKASKESVSAGLQAGSAAIKALESEAAQKGFEASAQQKREELQTKAASLSAAGDTEGAAAVTEQMNSITAATEQAAAKQALAMTTARGVLESYKESFKDLGPEGVLAATILEGSMQIADAFQTMTTAIENSTDGLGKAAAVAEFASAAIGQISQIMAANSNAQISQIDKQIEAEKRRDGKSAESVAKIAAMEKKKEAIERKAFNQRKKMQMAQTVVNTASGIMRAYADYDVATATGLAIMIGALGAAQLAIISKQKYEGGGSSEGAAKPTALTIGGRSKAVDVSKTATSGELNYLRGGQTTGQNLGGAGVSGPGAAMGRRGYANGDDAVVVGERGPEVAVFPGGTSIVPNYALGGQATNVNFTINAVDGQSVQNMLYTQRGNIIGMIREAANANGQGFLESVDPAVYGGGG